MPGPAAEPRSFATGGLRGETAGEGRAIVLCHGLTATRRSVVHGSRLLERAGNTVVTYDARGHGESDPAPAGEGYDYPALVADLDAVIESQAGSGDGAIVGGHSMGAHTAVTFALRNPGRVAGLVVIGPSYTAPLDDAGLAYWDGLAAALETGGVDGFVEYIGSNQAIDSAWRDSVLRFTRERMSAHRHLDAVAEALRQVARSRPFGGLEELESLHIPTLVVASDDAADPGHPREVAEAYAERLPRARLVSEAPGESPLAWQGGRLSREIAAFCAEEGA